MRQARLFILAAVLMGAGEAQPTFLRQDVPAPGSFLEYGSFTVGDFNGDGGPDLATVSPAGIAVMLNQGTRPGQSGVRFSEPVLTEFKAIGSGVAADFNRDGKLDLIGLTWATPGGPALAPSMHAMLLLGRGDGTFSAAAGHRAGSGGVDRRLERGRRTRPGARHSGKLRRNDPAR